MLTCRSIPPAKWEEARQLLVFYFSRRHLHAKAEDLAQDTLVALWNRADYQFAREEDFPRICYAFARHIMMADGRGELKHAAVELDEGLTAAPAPNAFGLSSTEMTVFLREVVKVGLSKLRQGDWQIIQRCTVPDGREASAEMSTAEANKVRVRLHRARKRLARLTGWKKTLL